MVLRVLQVPEQGLLVLKLKDRREFIGLITK